MVIAQIGDEIAGAEGKVVGLGPQTRRDRRALLYGDDVFDLRVLLFGHNMLREQIFLVVIGTVPNNLSRRTLRNVW